jgi:hypothetical protein
LYLSDGGVATTLLAWHFMLAVTIAGVVVLAIAALVRRPFTTFVTTAMFGRVFRAAAMRSRSSAFPVRTLKKGSCMLVLGMPLLNLALIAWRANEGVKNPDVLSWNLPYEMVIVADYKDNRCEP